MILILDDFVDFCNIPLSVYGFDLRIELFDSL